MKLRASFFYVLQEKNKFLANPKARLRLYFLCAKKKIERSVSYQDPFIKIYRFKNKRPIITTFVPFGISSKNFGGSLRIHNVYLALSKFFNVNIVTLEGGGERISVDFIGENLINYKIPYSDKYIELLNAEQKKAGGMLHDILLIENFDLINNLVKFTDLIKHSTDFFITSHPYFYGLFKQSVPKNKFIYEAHNNEFLLKKTYFPSLNKHSKYYLNLLRKTEEKVCKDSSFIMSVSSEDIQSLKKFYNINLQKFILVENCVENIKFDYSPYKKNIFRKVVVFVGSNHYPNVEAVNFIIEQLAPHTKDCKYIIIGNIADYFANNFSFPENVFFKGTISDQAKIIIYKKADLAINPMFSGSGSNLKLIEYVSFKLPVLTTPFGLRGYEKLRRNIFFAEKSDFLLKLNKFFDNKDTFINNKINLTYKAYIRNYTPSKVVIPFAKVISRSYSLNAKVGKKLIVLDGRPLQRNVTGTERYIFELFTRSSKNKSFNTKLLTSNVNREFLSNYVKRRSIETLNINDKIDLYHKTFQYSSVEEIEKISHIKSKVFTLLDLISIKHREYFSSDNHYDNFYESMRLGLDLSDRVIAISHHAKNDVVSTFKIDPNKVDVIHLGIDRAKFYPLKSKTTFEDISKRYLIPGKYILYIGTDYPHKNIKNLYIAFDQIINKENFDNIYLVMAGMSYYNDKNYLSEYLSPIKHRVINIGHVREADLNALYSNAEVFVYPSLYEGFGLPILEAFACKVPVICSNFTSIPEVAGDSAFSIDTSNPKILCNAILDVINDKALSKKFILNGLKRLDLFTWEKCAQATLNTYKKVLSN